ncbi:ATP-binding protein [Helicobacter sp. MIT 21-1697]|uniref:ATP-binding protein n=1 Tax=Helicobacter sp. MIT 21-1697 TaxID=2993733 RepID=UPI00224B80FB|nr:ATP-binding protein [Helicobacter sp. MIT 21-1697]MCX2717708.1 ATP-binding protein [Helicobacter sp. MIT 21-1697]
MKINVNIPEVVEQLKNVKVENIIFESMMNAIQANATLIELKIIASSLDDKNKTPYIDKIEVIDNGDGFNEENLKSFGEYRSGYKKSLGCKGVGRFMYLKLFKNVKIISKNKEFDFTYNGMTEPKEQVSYDKTKVILSNPKNNFSVDFSKIKKQIKEHFLAYFKTESKDIQIDIYRNNECVDNVKSNEIPDFKKKEFKIKNYSFSISYLFGENDFKNEGFYVANNRVVIKNSDLEQESKYNLPKEKDLRIFYLLESNYFDKNVNDERNELQIYPKRKNSLEFEDLSWNDIYDELENQLKAIYREHNFDVENTIKENRKKSIKELPYLGVYFENRNELNVNDMLENAKKEFNEDKDFLRDDSNKAKRNYESKLTKVTQAELAEYVFDRNKLIQQLKNSVDKGDIEAEIHNLFMPKKTFDDKQDYRSNNVWLFDDRFMCYDKIFSDIQIKNIFPELHKNIERPDLLSIISNTYEKDKITDILLIEFKKPEAKKEYFAIAHQQILGYAAMINEVYFQKKVRIWAYGFLKFSDEVLKSLINDDYNQIYTNTDFPICYKYNQANNIIIHFMDYNSLICDAENRNQLFLDILRGKYL